MSEIAGPYDLHSATTTVMFADVVEYVRLVQRDEAGAVRRIRALLIHGSDPLVALRGGRVVQRMGDGLLLTFPSPSQAAHCALDLHQLAEQQSSGLADEDKLYLRIGIHLAEVLTDDQTLFGHGVNLASRITALAGPGQTVVSSATRDRLTPGLDGDIEDLGDCYVKHVAEPVRIYRIQREDPSVPPAGASPSGELLPRLAVLPFEEYVPGSTALGVGDVVTDQLISLFSRSPAMSVISRLSCHALRGRGLAIDEVGKRLAVDYVLSGRFQTSGERVMILAELVQVRTLRVVWAGQVRGSADDALSAESDLVLGIGKPVADAIIRTEVVAARSGSLPTVSSHALYLFAVSVLHRFSRSEFERARLMLDALRERAPRHPAPLAWLARWHMLRAVQGWSADPAQDGREALSWANRALDIDPQSSLALTMAGAARRSVARDLESAQDYFERALATNPNEPLAWLFKGTIHGLRGESVSALESSDRALLLSPLDPMRSYYESLCATAATGAGAYERSIALARLALRGNVNHGSTYRTMAISQAMLGRLDEARATVVRLLEVEPASTVENFLVRAGERSPLNLKFAEALAAAGLPERATPAVARC